MRQSEFGGSGVIGYPAGADRLAGEDARPTNLFLLYGGAKAHGELLKKYEE